MAEEKKLKPTTEGAVECPCCEAVLLVRQYKIRTNEPVKAEYEIKTEVEVEKQGRLYKDDKPPKARVVKKGEGAKGAAG